MQTGSRPADWAHNTTLKQAVGAVCMSHIDAGPTICVTVNIAAKNMLQRSFRHEGLHAEG